MRSLELCLAVLAFAGLAGAAPPQWGAPARKPAAAATSARARSTDAQSDAQIEAAIRAKLAKSKIGADKFTVRVQGGVAHWEGKTDVVQHKGVATRMAKSAGAIAVDNRIQISQEARDKAAANLEKGRRRVQVKRGENRSDLRSDTRPTK